MPDQAEHDGVVEPGLTMRAFLCAAMYASDNQVLTEVDPLEKRGDQLL
jgi:hypothetical protein